MNQHNQKKNKENDNKADNNKGDNDAKITSTTAVS
jgi:hypothetical protein